MKRAASFIFFGLFVASCASNKQIKQANPSMPAVVVPASSVELSGPWNDSDAGATAQELVNDCLSGTWLSNATLGSQKPTIILGTVSNLSKESINTQSLIDDLESLLIKSGKVAFVANKDERVAVRNERLDQDTNASDDSKKEHGQELGADYMLGGTINTVEDRAAEKPVMVYQVTLRIIDIRTNTIPWSGQKKTRKYIINVPASQVANATDSSSTTKGDSISASQTVIAPVKQTNPTPKVTAPAPEKKVSVAKKIQGNKNTHLYHVPGSGYFGRISPQNLVWFESEAAARNAGYTKAKPTIVGNSYSKIYHMPWQDDTYTSKISKWHRVYFDTESDAISAGYRRSKI